MLSLKDTKSNHKWNLKDADVLRNNQKHEQASDLEDSHRQTEACSASSSVTSSLSTSTSSREHGKRQRQSVSFQTGLRRAKRRWSKSRGVSARVWLESWKLRQKVLKLCQTWVNMLLIKLRTYKVDINCYEITCKSTLPHKNKSVKWFFLHLHRTLGTYFDLPSSSLSLQFTWSEFTVLGRPF